MRRFPCASLLGLFLLGSIAVQAAPPRTMGYQGVLTDEGGSPVPDGTYSMTFSIYGEPTGGTALWTETQDVPVAGGNFDVVLGKITPLSSLQFDDPFWLGLAVGGEAEMTPRTELTGAPYSHMARTVEDGGIVSQKISDGTVVRSLNGRTDTVNIVPGENVTVTPINSDIIISANLEVENLPGVASAKGFTSGSLGDDFVGLATRVIDCPAPGYVLVIASADVFIHHQTGNPTYVVAGISDESTALPTNQDLVAQIPFSAPTGTYTIPLTSHGIYSVDAGINTFYFLGRKGSANGAASAGNRQLSLVYFEQSYGTVSTLATEGNPVAADRR